MRGWIKGKWIDLRDRLTRRFIIARLRRRRPDRKSTKHEQTEEDTMPTTWHRELPPDPQPPPAQSASPSPSASQFPLPPESMSESAERNASQTTVPIPPTSPRHASLRFSQTPLFEPPRSEYGDNMSEDSGISEREEPWDIQVNDMENTERKGPQDDNGKHPERDDRQMEDGQDDDNKNSERDDEQKELMGDSERIDLENYNSQKVVRRETDREDSFRKDIAV